MRNRLEFAVAIQLLRTCRTVGKHSSEQKNHTWIIYNWAILYSSTLIGRGILYSLINIIIRTRATKIRSDVDRREKFSMACFNRRPETLVSHKSEMSKSRTACKLSAENKHNSYSAGRKPSWMTSRSIGTDGEPHFQIIENLWNMKQIPNWLSRYTSKMTLRHAMIKNAVENPQAIVSELVLRIIQFKN